jgi:hypothetical protein
MKRSYLTEYTERLRICQLLAGDRLLVVLNRILGMSGTENRLITNGKKVYNKTKKKKKSK